MLRNRAVPAASSRWRKTILRAALAALVAAVTPALCADEAHPAGTASPNAEPGWHVIRPGDTLQTLAAKYLGSADLWPEIHRLNPGIDDPHWIYPGRKIRILLERPSAAPNAQVEALSRHVEARPLPVAWVPAETGVVLLERDGLRTYENSSARLRFDDGTSATVSEDSLVFIRSQTPARSPSPRKEIEIERGQAELATRPSASLKAPEIEIIVGGARSAAAPRPDGALRARSRKVGDGAQFMMYDGKARVSAAGKSVELAEGTGSVVAAAAPPSPAERLLPAPQLLDPAEGAELGRDEPALSWQSVPGATRYVVEVCGDVDCGRVLERQRDVAATNAAITESQPDGPAFWRVTAIAASGLDGYPSPSRSFTLVASVAPAAPLVQLLAQDGSSLPEGACSSAPPRLDVRARDGRGRELPWKLVIDGVEGAPESLRSLTSTGEHALAATAIDERGRTATSPALRFRLDLASPTVELPPASGVATAVPHSERPSRKQLQTPVPAADPCASRLEVGREGGTFVRIACGDASSSPTELALRGERDGLDLRTSGGRTVRLGEFWDVSPTGTVRLSFADQGCGLSAAAFRLMPSPYAVGRSLLEVVVHDASGRSSRMTWHVDTP